MSKLELSFTTRDEFQRQPIADKLIALLRSDLELSPMVLDGRFGAGKTEFCQKLIEEMQKEDLKHVIYVDAFRADHADEPLLTVLAEVIKLLPEDDRARFLKKVIPVARYVIKGGLKAIASHMLKQNFDGLENGFREAIADVGNTGIDAAINAVLKDHVDAEKNLKTLQTALAEIAKKKPLILFIDELDRCRPDFAIDMLEVIKHTFDIPGILFVLVTNTQQLKAAINYRYGESVDSQRYLDKFLKFTFKLSDKCRVDGNQLAASAEHYRNLIDKSSILKNSYLTADSPNLALVDHLIKIHSLSLREIETVVRHMEIYYLVGKQPQPTQDVLLLRITGILLFVINPDLAQLFLSGPTDAKDLCAFFGETDMPEFGTGHDAPDIYKRVLVMLAQESDLNSAVYRDPDSKEKWARYISTHPNKFEAPKKNTNYVIHTIKTIQFQG